MQEEKKVPFYKKNWFIVLTLILFFPIGLILMWVFANWSNKAKGIITAIIIFLVLIGGCTSDDESTGDTASTDGTEESTEEVTEELTEEVIEEPTEEETTEEETEEVPTEESTEEEPQEEPQEESTPVEEIESVIENAIGEDKVTEMNVTEYDGNYEVDVTFEASENFSANMIANGIRRDIVDTALDLKATDHYVSYLLLTATLPLTDDSGNESPGQVIAASFEGETIEELNADNEIFLYDNLENAADGYSAHPDFR